MIEVRPLADETFEPASRWLSDPTVNRWLTSVWRGRQVPVTMLALAARSDKNAIYVIHADGLPCGLVGLAEIDPMDRVAMIWYLTAPGFGGKGAATEGIAQVTRDAFEKRGLRCVYAWIMEDNAPSRRVLEKNGYKLVGRLREAADSGGRAVDRLYFDRVPSDKETNDMAAKPDVKARVLAYFDSKGGVPGETEDEKLGFEYLDAGLIDSMGIVEMLQSFEGEFGVRFSPSHMQSADFRTVGGLVRIITKLSA